MSALLKLKPKKSATILRAVPESTKDDAALPSHNHNTATEGRRDGNDGNRPSSAGLTVPLPSRSTSIWGRRRKSIASAVVATGASNTAGGLSASSHASLVGTIGTYKHGKIQWRKKNRKTVTKHKKNIPSGARHPAAKPKIQVVIPCGKPLPALPFLETGPTDLESHHEVSPPSASHHRIRDSIVSPLAHPQTQHTIRQTAPVNTRYTPNQFKSSFESNSSCNESQDSDASSLHSNHSSETSVEVDKSPTQGSTCQPSAHLPSGQTLAPRGTLHARSELTLPFNGSQSHAPPSIAPREYIHPSSSDENLPFQPTCALHVAQSKPRLNRRSSKRSGPRQNLAADASMGMINEAKPSGTEAFPIPPRASSPTLSEAEFDLHAQLASSFGSNSDPRMLAQDGTPLAERNPSWRGMRQASAGDGKLIDTTGQPRRDFANAVLPDNPPPAVPRKSSRRRLAARTTVEVNRLPRDHIASQLKRKSFRTSRTLTLMIPQYKRSSVDLVFSPRAVSTKTTKPPITSDGAEKVILNIFQHLDHFNDLFAAASINRGFYRVFKRHELDLIKSTLQKMSPPAWEFREIAFPGHELLLAADLETTRPAEEYTPTSYLKLQKRDIQVIRTIKLEIMEKCQSFVRPEISAALMSACPAESARVDDALWRIWTFCKLFGSGKGREEDIVAQMDWLNGGMLVHQATCTFSMMSTDLMSDTLVGAPECFGQGNEGGLTAEQLFDMMELWTCLSVLLQNFEGRTVQARQAGIYDNTDIRGGDIDGEEMMLDEWIYHLLTFGLDTVLKLTGPFHPSDPKAFVIAAENGWVNWKPPVLDGTRQYFLKEAARRVYEDKIAHTYAKISIRDVQRQQSKIRIQKHIDELKDRKRNGEQRPMVLRERPMSDWDTVIRNLTRPPLPPQGPGKDIITHVPALRSSSVEDIPTSVPLPRSRSTSSRTASPPRRTVAQPLLPSPPPSTVPSNHDRHSISSILAPIRERTPSPPRRTVAQPLLPSPSVTTVQSNRDLYTMGSVSSASSPPRRMFAQPLLPTPSASTATNSRDWHRYSTGTSMPSILEDPLHHPLSEPPGPPHPAFRPHPMSMPYRGRHMRQSSSQSSAGSSTPRGGALQQHEQQHHIYGSRSHENTADKAIWRIVEMGFTAEQAREALRLTDLGDGLRVDRAVELLLSRQT